MHVPTLTRTVRGAFLLPVFALMWASGLPGDRPTGAALAAVVLVCALAGVLWQLLHRRDLADRLTHFVSGFTVGCLFLLPLLWNSSISSSIGGGFGAAAVLAGLVYSEQFLRWRTARAVRPTAVAMNHAHQ